MEYLVIALGLSSLLGFVIWRIWRRKRSAPEGKATVGQIPIEIKEEKELESQPAPPADKYAPEERLPAKLFEEVESTTGGAVREVINKKQPQPEDSTESKQLREEATLDSEAARVSLRDAEPSKTTIQAEEIAGGRKEHPALEVAPTAASVETTEVPKDEKEGATLEPLAAGNYVRESSGEPAAQGPTNGSAIKRVAVSVDSALDAGSERASAETSRTNEDRRLPDYIPPPARPPRAKSPRRLDLPAAQRDRAAEIRMQLFFGRHNFLQRIAFLAQRPENGPEEVELRLWHAPARLIALGDEWYELEHSQIARLLDESFELVTGSGGTTRRWQHRRRDVFVLACQQGFAGFVSATRLRVGYEQVVFSRESRAQEVADILAQAGCESLTPYGDDHGAPGGWLFFKPVVPRISLPARGDGDILDILRPQPDIEIDLRAGVWLEGNEWLAGYPPEIRVFGELPFGTDVLINNQFATRGADGIFTVPDYDHPGTHQIWCAGKVRNYSIVEPAEDWQFWDAHVFRSGIICGAVARTNLDKWCLTTVPSSNRLLVGAFPGEIFLCGIRPGSTWTGFVPFEVVWALPPDPLHSDKTSARVFLLKVLPPVALPTASAKKIAEATPILSWSSRIRNCRRKGLRVEPESNESKRLWDDYQKQAKALWRLLK